MELRAKTKRVFELNLLRVAATDSVEETGARVCCCTGWINAPKVSPYKWKKKLNQIHPIITDQSFRSNNKFSKIMLPIHGLMVTSMQSTGQHRLSVNTKWTYSDTGSWKHSRLSHWLLWFFPAFSREPQLIGWVQRLSTYCKGRALLVGFFPLPQIISRDSSVSFGNILHPSTPLSSPGGKD